MAHLSLLCGLLRVIRKGQSQYRDVSPPRGKHDHFLPLRKASMLWKVTNFTIRRTIDGAMFISKHNEFITTGSSRSRRVRRND